MRPKTLLEIVAAAAIGGGILAGCSLPSGADAKPTTYSPEIYTSEPADSAPYTSQDTAILSGSEVTTSDADISAQAGSGDPLTISAPSTEEPPTIPEPSLPTAVPTDDPSDLNQSPTPTALVIPPDNNPLVQFDYNFSDYSIGNYLEDKLTNLKGTVVDSYLDQMYVWVGNENGGSAPRTFSWLVLRDQTNTNRYYLIYPGDRVFPKGTSVNIQEYWTLKHDIDLTNNLLVLLTNPNGPRSALNYYHDINFLIESGAPDGLVDGIIPLGKVEYMSATDGLAPTAAPSPTPEVKP